MSERAQHQLSWRTKSLRFLKRHCFEAKDALLSCPLTIKNLLQISMDACILQSARPSLYGCGVAQLTHLSIPATVLANPSSRRRSRVLVARQQIIAQSAPPNAASITTNDLTRLDALLASSQGGEEAVGMAAALKEQGLLRAYGAASQVRSAADIRVVDCC